MSKDVIPTEVFDAIDEARQARGLTWNAIGKHTGLGMREIQNPSKTKRGFRRWVIDRLGTYLESDELTRVARSDVYWDTIVEIVPTGEQETYDLEIAGTHNFFANDFVVHNSHATSFALIAYITCWVRKHYLPEFTASLLNAHPMGFYAPATIVGDAQRHGVEVRPVDVVESAWDCTLEPTGQEDELAVRMGLRWVQGMQLVEGQRIVAAREARPFESIEDFVRRTGIATRTHDALAQAGAFGQLARTRRDALWQVAGWVRRTDDAIAEVGDGGADRVAFATLSQLDHILWDYGSSQHSTRGHPLAPLRAELRGRGWPDARGVATARDGQRIDYVGIVICRQQPATAAGVTFMTLEDETGFVNLVIWAAVFAEYGSVARTTSLLGVSGRLQIQETIVHLIAEELWVPKLSRAVAEVTSRDFH